MRDGRPERPLGGAHGVDVDPLRVVGRLREPVDPLLVTSSHSVGPSSLPISSANALIVPVSFVGEPGVSQAPAYGARRPRVAGTGGEDQDQIAVEAPPARPTADA